MSTPYTFAAFELEPAIAHRSQQSVFSSGWNTNSQLVVSLGASGVAVGSLTLTAWGGPND